jgi:drug/metabolite transporter (DMT)-like permease
MRLKADLVLLLVAVLWGSAFAAQRAAGLLGSVHFFNAARFLVAALLLLPFAARSKIAPRQVLWTCSAGVILFAGSALQQAGLRTTTAGNAGFLTSLYVVIVPFVVFVGWRERPHLSSIGAVMLAALGAYLLSTAGQFRLQDGDLLELGGALFWAVHVVILGKFATRYDAFAFSAGQLLVASGLSWIAAAFLDPRGLPLSPTLIGSILYTAVISLGMGYTLQIWGQRHTPPTDAGIILSLESVFAATAGGFVFGERWMPIQLLGCAIIVLAVLLSQAGGWSRMSPSTARAGAAGPEPAIWARRRGED